MNAEIREYEGKAIGSFTARQLIAVGGIITITILFILLGKIFIPKSVVPWLVIICVIPIGCFGFAKPQDMKFERYLKVLINYYLQPQKYVYKDTEHNLFLSIRENILEDEIIQQKINKGLYDEDEVEWSEWKYVDYE
jgi:hypothetical protein